MLRKLCNAIYKSIVLYVLVSIAILTPDISEHKITLIVVSQFIGTVAIMYYELVDEK